MGVLGRMGAVERGVLAGDGEFVRVLGEGLSAGEFAVVAVQLMTRLSGGVGRPASVRGELAGQLAGLLGGQGAGGGDAAGGRDGGGGGCG